MMPYSESGARSDRSTLPTMTATLKAHITVCITTASPKLLRMIRYVVLYPVVRTNNSRFGYQIVNRAIEQVTLFGAANIEPRTLIILSLRHV